MLQSSLPPLPGIELGQVSAYMQDAGNSVSAHMAPSSILALDRLRLGYSVGWPLNLVINPHALSAYNTIMIFLMQIKRAKCALDHMQDRPTVRPRRIGARGMFSREELELSRQQESRTAADRYGSWNTRYLLLRAELRHVVNNVENYIMSQIHGAAASNLELQLQLASALDQVLLCKQLLSDFV
jgi:hypothetical protein